MGEYDKSLHIQLNRLDISTWLRSCITDKSIIPLFQPSRDNAIEELNMLCDAIEQIELTSTDMAVIPAAFEREMNIVQKQIHQLSERLEAIQKRIRAETQALSVYREESYTLEAISRFIGRMEATITTY